MLCYAVSTWAVNEAADHLGRSFGEQYELRQVEEGVFVGRDKTCLDRVAMTEG
jgi:hypothetical protein